MTSADREEPYDWVSSHPNGQKAVVGILFKGKRHGKWTTWHDNGQKQSEGQYKGGLKVGEWVCWDKAGTEVTCSKIPLPDY